MSPVWPLWFPFDSFHYNRGWFSTAEFSSVQQCTGGVPADGNCLIGFVWLSSTVSFQMCSQMACLGGCIALHTHIRFFPTLSSQMCSQITCLGGCIRIFSTLCGWAEWWCCSRWELINWPSRGINLSPSCPPACILWLWEIEFVLIECLALSIYPVSNSLIGYVPGFPQDLWHPKDLGLCM